MYSTIPGLTLGFHGCDESIVEKILLNQSEFKKSRNLYDWLGHGIYFWENSPSRTLEYAEFLKSHPHRSKKQIKNPAIIGAVLDLGHCLDFTDYQYLEILKETHNTFIEIYKNSEFIIPENKTLKSNSDLLLRDLDCAVIETLHKINSENEKQNNFDSVKAVFWEGEELYPNAGFKEKNHIQICIRNPNCIKGLFSPRILNNYYSKV